MGLLGWLCSISFLSWSGFQRCTLHLYFWADRQLFLRSLPVPELVPSGSMMRRTLITFPCCLCAPPPAFFLPLLCFCFTNTLASPELFLSSPLVRHFELLCSEDVLIFCTALDSGARAIFVLVAQLKGLEQAAFCFEASLFHPRAPQRPSVSSAEHELFCFVVCTFPAFCL